MGTSTDAKLFYGYVWEDEADLLAEHDDEDGDGGTEWEEIIAKSRGIADPWEAYPDLEGLPYAEQRQRGSQWTADHRAELDAWHEAKKAIGIEYGVEIDRHGSDEWQVPIIKITGAGHTAARGYPHEVSAETLAVGPDWDDKLRRFVADLGIDASEAKGPGWFIASWWG